MVNVTFVFMCTCLSFFALPCFSLVNIYLHILGFVRNIFHFILISLAFDCNLMTHTMMNNVEGFYSKSDIGNDGDMESKVANVEIGDNVAIIVDELENGNPFYIILCNGPLHRC